MSVSSLTSSITYTADGVSVNYTIPFYFINQQDITVQSLDTLGNIINYRLNVDYSIAGVTNLVGDYPNGGLITFNIAPTLGLLILIQRTTNRTQEDQLLNNGVFTADILNHIHDKVMLITQEGFISGYKGLALAPPTTSNVSYNLGDWLKNANPVPGYMFGWVCTTAGSPGVWMAFGNISMAF